MRVNFDKPIIEKECVLETVIGDLDDFYASASDIDRINLICCRHFETDVLLPCIYSVEWMG